jgi:truncated hemoglobin YjbI
MPLSADPPALSEHSPDQNLFHAIGGREGCHRLVTAFYAHVVKDPILHPLYPAHIKCSVEALTAFLTQFLGGPYDYDGRPWSMSLRAAHRRFAIGSQERVAWLANMFQAIDDINMQEPARSALRWVFIHASAYLVNQPQQTANDVTVLDDLLEAEQNAPDGSPLRRDITFRWEAHQSLDQVIVAIRQHEVDHALRLLKSRVLQDLFGRERAAWLNPLALLIMSNQPILLDYAEQQLIRDPALATERYMGERTLLQEVAGQGNVRIVAVLLRLGADPNAMDQYRHTPLYCVSNAYPFDGVSGAEIVSLLAQAGANVNVRDQVKQCTALHMAARRGNVLVAQSLLRHGADIEARDKNGDTPLHRAVKCGHVEMVAFLLSQGADVQAKTKSGQTPQHMARGQHIQQALQDHSPK